MEVHVDESAIIKNQLVTTQSMPEISESLNLNVSMLINEQIYICFYISQ